MNGRWLNNFTATCIVLLILLIIIASSIGGCTTIKWEMVDGSKTESLSVKAWPKDWKKLDYEMGTVKLKAGMAITTDDPYTEIINEAIPKMLCLENPLFCVDKPE
jgi:hypothetical protein